MGWDWGEGGVEDMLSFTLNDLAPKHHCRQLSGTMLHVGDPKLHICPQTLPRDCVVSDNHGSDKLMIIPFLLLSHHLRLRCVH